MPSVTKTFKSEFHGVSVSPDGATISTSIGWIDSASDPKNPMSGRPSTFTNLRISGGAVYLGNVKIADAPADLADAGKALAAKMSALAESLISSGKIKP